MVAAAWVMRGAPRGGGVDGVKPAPEGRVDMHAHESNSTYLQLTPVHLIAL